MPSWSAWMIARTKAESSGTSTRFIIFVSAFERLSPMRISPSASPNSSASGPSMCSVSFEMAPSKPRPASTETASRSRASGSSARRSSLRPRVFIVTIVSGSMKPTRAPTNPSSRALEASAPATLAKTWPPTKPRKQRIAFEAR